MAPPSTAAVTAQGIRDGEPGALRALVKRRGSAVLAYCKAVAAPGEDVEAAGQSFAQFRREVVSTEHPRALDPEALLLRTTRRAAAARAPRHEPAAGVLNRRWAGACPLVPELLAARLEGDLTPADDQRLERHLERCEGCRAQRDRFRSAEDAYREAPEGPPPSAVLGGLVAALRAAAPNRERESVHTNGAKAAVDTPAPAPEPVAAATPDEPPPVTPAPAAAPAAAAGVDSPTLSWAPGDLEPEPEPEPPDDPSRRARRIAARIVLPAVIVLGAFVGALVAGGAFDGTPDREDATPTVTEPAVDRNPPRPSTTPLPERTGGAQPASRQEPEPEPERERVDSLGTAEPEIASVEPGTRVANQPLPPDVLEPAAADPNPRRPPNDGGAEAPETGGAPSAP